MAMVKFIKKIGKFFILLKQKNEKDIRQSILLVNGSFILPNNFALIIKSAKEKFKNANFTVLTFKDKKEFIKDNFPDVEVIIPESNIRPKRYQLTIQLFALLRRDFTFIILSSLDISLVSISLIFAGCPVLLHNRWMQWYRLRLRTVSDLLRHTKSADKNRRIRNNGIKGILKNLGRFFVILSDLSAEDTKCHILLEDNGYTGYSHILTAVKRIEEVFINPEITILTFSNRKQRFIDMFPQMKLIVAEEGKNGLAIQMFRMRKYKFNCLILTSLDILPIIISFLFIRTKVLLYNRWYQWWSLNFRNICGYLKEVLIFLVMIPTSIYLLITAILILVRTGFRGLKFKSIVKGKNGKRYNTF